MGEGVEVEVARVRVCGWRRERMPVRQRWQIMVAGRGVIVGQLKAGEYPDEVPGTSEGFGQFGADWWM